MFKITKMCSKQVGSKRLVGTLTIILGAALIITTVILHGLVKENKLMELLPDSFINVPKLVQYWAVYYYFFSLFIRAGVLLLQGFLAFQIIARSRQTQRLSQITTFPFSRRSILAGMFLMICIFSGMILLLLHSSIVALTYLKFKQFLPGTYQVFLVKDWLLDLLYGFIALIPASVALLIPKVSYVVGSAVLMIIILCNAGTLSFGTNSIQLPLITLLALLVIATLLGLVAFKKFALLEL
ncbi:hypothetical protein [Pediococcus acidilactici]|uniref:hypothetical protein n=1 Tax=Pediococcus acidilactici TaxID=1254 RepID=UPI001330377F|nr:hypothetical protein [Pediococcus acidilactici]KAF0488967.1 hypothetical protein GBP18_08470 [Pediococcus acidilactici]